MHYIVVQIIRIGNMTTNWYVTSPSSIAANMSASLKFATKNDAERFVREHGANRNYGIVEIEEY